VQSRVCLTGRHAACPLYIKDWQGSLPLFLKKTQKPVWKRKLSFLLAGASGLGAVIVVLFGQQPF
jgi:hypothetical protein